MEKEEEADEAQIARLGLLSFVYSGAMHRLFLPSIIWNEALSSRFAVPSSSILTLAAEVVQLCGRNKSIFTSPRSSSFHLASSPWLNYIPLLVRPVKERLSWYLLTNLSLANARFSNCYGVEGLLKFLHVRLRSQDKKQHGSNETYVLLVLPRLLNMQARHHLFLPFTSLQHGTSRK